MKRERDIERRLHGLEALSEAVTALKSLSAHHFRESRAALAPARTYRAGVEELARRVGASLPAGTGPRGLLVIGAELGLCGGYNHEVVAAGVELRRELGSGPTFCVGRRAQMLLAHHGVESSSSYTMPAGPRGIGPLLLAVAQDMLVGYVEENLSSFDVVASRFDGVGAYVPVTTRLMPASPPPEATPVRTRYVDAQTLGAVAIRELLYIEIHGILLDALASEHGARLAATQAAEGWLGRRIDELRHHLTSARRESSTQEVIEIASGARARGRKPGWV